ncbi:Sjogren's syndrome/scleroderma autoantigen 1 family protein [Haloferax sp. S1W]|uniref:Sjogren's syndrome/scleroderma autoantigen 1 family protein n=1 Tax=Haloferax sp. S1W TaxID=3377110 RepID=UPI0037C69529
MSDFDKEAERQRLREKYEQDTAKRRSTQRMSELLLKGATMTNRHCDQCGDPIFRYNGSEFCPTCQTEGQASASAGGEGDTDATVESSDAAETAATEATESDVDTPEAVDAPAAAANTAESAAAEAPTSESAATNANTDSAAAAPVQDDRANSTADTTPERAVGAGSGARRTPQKQPESASHDVAGDIASARASLVRTLTWAANEAESTSDPRRAAEYLSAAREAAAAIDALDR